MELNRHSKQYMYTENLVDDIDNIANQWRNAEYIGYTYEKLKLDTYTLFRYWL